MILLKFENKEIENKFLIFASLNLKQKWVDNVVSVAQT
jgi:hypothetical protein